MFKAIIIGATGATGSQLLKKLLDDQSCELVTTVGRRSSLIGKKNDKIENIHSQYMGLLKFSPRGWSLAFELFNSLEEEKKNKLDMTLFLSMLINQTEIKVVFVEGKWCEVDCNNDVETYEKILQINEKWSHDWR